MKRRINTIDCLLVAVLLTMLATLALLAFGGGNREGEEYEAALHELSEVDALLNRDLLQLAIGELQHYDSLVASARSLRRIENRLNREPAGLGSVQGFTEARLSVSILLGQKLELLEGFKTAHAQSKAAQDYFPELVRTIDTFRTSGSDVSREDLFVLMGTTAHYLQDPAAHLAGEIRSQLEAFALPDNVPLLSESQADLAHLAARIGAIVDGKEHANAVYRELSAVPVAEAGSALATAFGGADRARQRTALYSFAGFLSALAVALGALAILPRWRQRRLAASAAEQEAELKEALKVARAQSAYLKRDEQQEAARLAEARHAALVRHSFEVMAIISRQDHYIYVSPACEHLFGLTEKELIGKSVYEGIHTDDLIKVEDYFMRAQKELQMEDTVQYRVMDAYGKWYLVESFASNQASNPAIRGMVLNTRILHAVETGRPTAAR